MAEADYQKILKASEMFRIYYNKLPATGDTSIGDATSSLQVLRQALTANNEASTANNEASTADQQDLKGPAAKFLCDVNDFCGREVAFLCVMGLKKHRLKRISKDDRSALLKILGERNDTLVHESLVRFIWQGDPKPEPRYIYDAARDSYRLNK